MEEPEEDEQEEEIKEPPTGEIIDGAFYKWLNPPPFPSELACQN